MPHQTGARRDVPDLNSILARVFGMLALAASASVLTAGPSLAQLAVPPETMNKVEAGTAGKGDKSDRIIKGLKLFTEETFGGNGRTCASCHPVTHNFTIDPEFIGKLPDDDPLFVAEQNRKLGDLERRQLMRRFGLILENLDGFDTEGVMRGVPHTLGMSRSLTPPDTFLLTEATGWSGDGAPGDGSLRSFAIGAVTQHLTKSLDRNGCSHSEFRKAPKNCDFRVPTDAELDALLAFQLFIGRDEEVNIVPDDPDALVFADKDVEKGKVLFQTAPTVNGGTASCAFCHENAGANSGGRNANFATGTNRHANAPACRSGAKSGVPGDGGFGRSETEGSTRIEVADFCDNRSGFDVTFEGDMTMNTPSLVEAADTPPFFHNNSADTIEEAVAFYASDTFGSSPAARNGSFDLSTKDVNRIAALLRALNIQENLRSGAEYNDMAMRVAARDETQAWTFVDMARADTQDALQVLKGGPLDLFGMTRLARYLRKSHKAEKKALKNHDFAQLRTANKYKDRAQAQMLAN